MHSPLSLDATICFIELLGLLKPYLLSLQSPAIVDPPNTLPWNVAAFLCDALVISEDQLHQAWLALQNHIWEHDLLDTDALAARTKHIGTFLKYGLVQNREIGIYSLEPPMRTCPDPTCGPTMRDNPGEVLERDLVESSRLQVTIFTREFGAIPAFANSTYCRKCYTRYFHNYRVQGNIRKYHMHENIQFIQIGTHFYVERSLCELFSVMMATAWTSSTNCARIYHEGLSNPHVSRLLPPDWRFGFELDVKAVSNAFFLHSLLLDHSRRGTVLELLHQASSPARSASALLLSSVTCLWLAPVKMNGTMAVQPAVGLMNKLTAQRCSEPASTGYRTCAEPTHRWLETYHELAGKGMFQLKRRLQRAQTSQPNDALSSGVTEPDSDEETLEGDGADSNEDIELDVNTIVCDGKPETGNRIVRARFGRTMTHNEELCVSSCGIILGRATFYGSEAPNAVVQFWEALFPTKKSLPQVLWHDNNCRIMAMLRNEPQARQDYFKDVAKPVDVFHFKCKHKEGDLDCGRDCNALIWPELSVNGKWRFNSSAAEQTNAWFGGFQSIVREMPVERYEFFLDEVIRRRNIWMVKLLAQRGCLPHSIPREELLGHS
ncbi:hypothetical protein MIND_01165100 [Mycena indigotica]|uniref:CxC5 like cysteine cluster associated with KDZ domain-containing protein n=1 Tax=Mycena indigotica TaxID=2126181 RepID=A0A8H6S4C2_9AGAR|nr:uncharacterized protein MIND_01165100 [Mycena indigotica]KAF7292669.1 hypothetical protein MIND_01165100 [Mycena indigotica]